MHPKTRWSYVSRVHPFSIYWTPVAIVDSSLTCCQLQFHDRPAKSGIKFWFRVSTKEAEVSTETTADLSIILSCMYSSGVCQLQHLILAKKSRPQSIATMKMREREKGERKEAERKGNYKCGCPAFFKRLSKSYQSSGIYTVKTAQYSRFQVFVKLLIILWWLHLLW